MLFFKLLRASCYHHTVPDLYTAIEVQDIMVCTTEKLFYIYLFKKLIIFLLLCKFNCLLFLAGLW